MFGVFGTRLNQLPSLPDRPAVRVLAGPQRQRFHCRMALLDTRRRRGLGARTASDGTVATVAGMGRAATFGGLKGGVRDSIVMHVYVFTLPSSFELCLLHFIS